MTDELIQELYIYCIEARENGQEKIRVHAHPCRLSGTGYSRLLVRYDSDNDRKLLWEELKKAQEIFDRSKRPAQVEFLSTGRHRIGPA